MINLFVPDTFHGACAAVLMNGYAKAVGYGITVRYYRDKCIKEIRDLAQSIRVAEIEGISLPSVREIYVCGEEKASKKVIQLLADERNTVYVYGKNYFTYLYLDFVRNNVSTFLCPSPFANWLRSEKTQNFFDSAICYDGEREPLLYRYFDLGAEEFEQFVSDYLHIEGEESHECEE